MNKELIIPEITKNELSKVKENLLNKDQLNFLFKPTPKAHIYERPAKGGGTWKYVTGSYFKKVLNLMFGWNWDFEIMDEIINLDASQVIVKGRLTIRTGNQTIIRMQYGRQDIKFKNEYLKDDKGNNIVDTRGNPKKFKTTIPLDLGNDLKGASTDSLKKCASELGIASDVYAPNEYKQITIIEEPDPRSLLELQKMVDNCANTDELQILFDGISQDEKEIISDYIKVKQKEYER